jgi:phosphotriesterase-related protein
MGSRDPIYLKRVLERGVYVEYDYLGQAAGPNGSAERDERLVQNIAGMIKAGYARQLLVSHDICTKPQLKKNGGGGYTYVANVVLPGLKRTGVSDEDILTIMVENPRRVLTFMAPQPALSSSQP